jgi:tetratricopeptide (TPR) repeat protein
MIVTDVGLIALSKLQAIKDPIAIQQDLRAIGAIAIQALTGTASSQLADHTGNINWHQHAHCSQEFAAAIDRLVTSDPSQFWPSILPAAIELDNIMYDNTHLPDSSTTIDSIQEAEIEEMKMQADRKFIQGDAAGAIADYSEIIKRDPQPMYYHNRGIIYAYSLGNYEQAIEDHNTTLTLKPDFASAYQNRAHAQRMLGNLSAAIQDYSCSLDLLPNTAIIYWERGLTYQQLGDLTAALADYTRFLEYQPYHADAYHQRGNVHQKMGNVLEALADYDRSIEINPLSALAYYDRGGLQAQQSNFTAAIADYNQAIQLSPLLVRAYNNRGLVKRRQGDLVGAIADYSQGLSIEAESLDCLRNRGIARQQLKDYAGAITDYQRAANMYLRQGQHSEYEKIIKVVDILQRYQQRQQYG